MSAVNSTTRPGPPLPVAAPEHDRDTRRVAAVDVGGTGIRLTVTGARHVAHGPGRTVDRTGVNAPALLAGLRSTLEAMDLPEGIRVEAVAVGMSGLLSLTTEPVRLMTDLAHLFGTSRVVLASDVFTSYVGALGMRPGALVAAGTGAVALGTDFADCWRHRDGWGHLLGDEGSGAWIGAEGLRAALRAHDERPSGSTTLLRRAVDRYGPCARWPSQFYPHGDVAGRLAFFTTEVAAAALGGDPIAHDIWRRAAQHLADSVVAALPAHHDPLVSWCGGLFQAGALLRDPFEEAVRRAAPHARPTAPAGSSLDGAGHLARLACRTPELLPKDVPYLRTLTL
ncbi:N-acetylglucosamine kinase [Streptomyces sp. NPDC057694]|uniref:N-acetylglucosamine kinase n=1 Tax=Streptomyces sp. NPDC057694 TaxID=3346216 RepID=UPI00367EF05C